jgi:hypothetical protein
MAICGRVLPSKSVQTIKDATVDLAHKRLVLEPCSNCDPVRPIPRKK